MSLRRIFACITFLAVTVSSGSAVAQQLLTLPPEIETVVTGGWWQSPQLSGTYRVIIRTGGFDHLISEAQIDWIAETRSRDEPVRVVNSKHVETGSWRLMQPRIVKRSGGWQLLFPAVETHFNPPIRGTWKVNIGQPGEFKATLLKK